MRYATTASEVQGVQALVEAIKHGDCKRLRHTQNGFDRTQLGVFALAR